MGKDKNIRNNININLKMFFITLCIFGTSCLSNNANIVKREYIFPIKKEKSSSTSYLLYEKEKDDDLKRLLYKRKFISKFA